MPNQMRFNNLLEAAQPQPPSVAVFLDVLTRISNPQPEVAAHSMYGTMFKAAAVAAKPKGTKAVQSAVSKAVLQFEKVRNVLGATSTSLDVLCVVRCALCVHVSLTPSSLPKPKTFFC